MRQSAPFLGLAKTLEDVRSTRSKNGKVSILAVYLSGLHPEDAETATRVSTGRSSERGSKDEVQVGYSALLDVVKEMTGAGSEQVSKAYLRHGDLGEVAEELLVDKKEQTLFQEPLTLHDLEENFRKLRSTKGRGSSATRRALVKSLILRAAPVEGKYLVKVLTGEMRIGLVSGLVEEAISRAYSVPKEEVARAHMIVGDLGLLAGAAARGEVGGSRGPIQAGQLHAGGADSHPIRSRSPLRERSLRGIQIRWDQGPGPQARRRGEALLAEA